MRILLDTNVLIAAFISHGTCAELLEHCIRNHIVLTSPFILNEVKQTLLSKFGIDPDDVEESMELLVTGLFVLDPEALSEPVCRDPDDDNVLAAALSGRCDCIVTGDKDLLEIGEFEEIRILKPSDYWQFESTSEPRE